jgi:hypothetical protein
MCRVRGWDLSNESLTSFDARKKLRDLKVEDPAFWNELVVETVASDLPAPNEIVPEDTIDEGDDDEYGDDSSIGLAIVVKAVVDEGTAALKAVGIREDGGLVREAFAEDDNEAPADLIDGMVDKKQRIHTGDIDGSHLGTRTNTAADNSPEHQGHGRRKKISNKQFANFIRHDDNEDSDIEM